MRTLQYTLFCALALCAAAAAPGYGSPASYKLLCLVPPGATIVAGFENYHDPRHHGQLLLTTHNNRLDLDDWQAITGVDSKRSFHEVIEVAMPSAEDGSLREHLLMVSGHIDAEGILRAAQLNGAERTSFEGDTVMIIKPFDREKGKMVDIRWLAIVQNQVGLLGTPAMVQQALHRYRNHADADFILMERLSQLRKDVTAWNILRLPPARPDAMFLHQGSPWARLLEDADLLLIGTRFGSKVRVDLSLHASSKRGAEFFKQKVGSFAAIFEPEFSHRPDLPRRRPGTVLLEQDHVEASIEMPLKQFEMWGEQANRPRPPQSAPLRPGSQAE